MPYVLKRDNRFAVFDRFGDLQATMPAAEGLFFEDTRFLSQLALAVNDVRPVLLRSFLRDGNKALVVELTNPRLVDIGGESVPSDTLHIVKTISLVDDAMVVRLDLHNYGFVAARFRIDWHFDADFADVFELRGSVRRARGRRLPDEAGSDGATLGYVGLDRIARRTLLAFDPRPNQVEGRSERHRAVWRIDLPTGSTRTLTLAVRCEKDEPPALRSSIATPSGAEAPTAPPSVIATEIHTGSETFDALIARSRADLDMLVTATPQGAYPYAGLPWFSTPFGRDGLLTAFQCLWLEPAIAAGTLRFLAANQAAAVDGTTDAEPGKILHEMRYGEMAAVGEVPFSRYYGSVDATPLFVMLAAAYFERTGDLGLVRELWPNIAAALAWMETYGDADGDGFLEYRRKSGEGLANQGWKDSGDAIFHADGTLAAPPVALAEVQAYAYAALEGASRLAAALGEERRSIALAGAAQRLKQRFEAWFWLEEIGSYALALDGTKRPCRVRASNAGHVLFGGLPDRERAVRVARTLMAPPSFSGWGIRTLADGEVHFSPMAYHNGSVWPHDNGVIAMGFGRYGLRRPILDVLQGLADASRCLDLNRLPEFFCGFAREAGLGPTPHPVACAPQAWAAASVFAMLGALLGIAFDPAERRIRMIGPALPESLDRIEVANLRLGAGAAHFALRREDDALVLHDIRRHGDIDITVIP